MHKTTTKDSKKHQHEKKVKKQNAIHVALYLENVTAIKSSEEVDELYMAVTTYPSSGRPSHKQIPEFPRYWLSSHLGHVKDVQLWKGSLKPSESVNIHLSLIERDVPPFNVDDLVGTVILKILNSKGKIHTKLQCIIRITEFNLFYTANLYS